VTQGDIKKPRRSDACQDQTGDPRPSETRFPFQQPLFTFQDIIRVHVHTSLKQKVDFHEYLIMISGGGSPHPGKAGVWRRRPRLR